MVDTTAAVASAVATATAPAQPRVVPSVSQPIRVDYGSWLAQIAHDSEAVISSVAGAAAGAVLSKLPFGAIVSAFIGPTVIASYCQQAIHNLEPLLKTLPPAEAHNAVQTYLYTALNGYEPHLVAMLGDSLPALVKSVMAKFGLTV